jgi:hypothetical protein
MEVEKALATSGARRAAQLVERSRRQKAAICGSVGEWRLVERGAVGDGDKGRVSSEEQARFETIVSNRTRRNANG